MQDTISPPPQSRLRKILRISLGIAFLILGVLGLVFPILQGILFLIIGFLLLAPHSRFIQRRLDWFRNKYPHLYGRSHEIIEKLKAFWHRLIHRHAPGSPK